MTSNAQMNASITSSESHERLRRFKRAFAFEVLAPFHISFHRCSPCNHHRISLILEPMMLLTQ
jgi:hypothetical protein